MNLLRWPGVSVIYGLFAEESEENYHLHYSTSNNEAAAPDYLFWTLFKLGKGRTCSPLLHWSEPAWSLMASG